MTDPLPYAALDDALSQARYLLFDFNGPVCDLYAGQSAEALADALRAVLAGYAAQVPGDALASADPLAVLMHAHAAGAKLGEPAKAELTRRELAAVPSAQPAAYAHDAISSARESHRTVAVLSTCSTQAMRAYLTSVSLDELVDVVIGRTPGTLELTADNLIAQTLSALTAEPADCTLISGTTALISAASAAGLATIAYAPAPATRTSLAGHAAATITSMADLVLRLRARPLPN